MQAKRNGECETPLARLKRVLAGQNNLSAETEELLMHDMIKMLSAYFELLPESAVLENSYNEDGTIDLCLKCKAKRVKNIKIL